MDEAANSVIPIDKEEDNARHGGGRNSGVLHVGFNSTTDSQNLFWRRKDEIDRFRG